MRRLILTGGSLVLLAMAPGAANAHATRHALPVPQQQTPRPQLVIVQADSGFVIRCETPRGSMDVGVPPGAIPPRAIPLGTSVQIERRVLQHFNGKEIPHGDIR